MNKWLCLLLTVASFTFILLSGCTSQKEVEKAQRREHEKEKKAEFASLVSALVKKYNATLFKAKKPLPYTFAYQNALMNTGRPILFYTALVDIEKKDEGYLFELYDIGLDGSRIFEEPKILLRLYCKSEHFEKLRPHLLADEYRWVDNPMFSDENIAVIAKITKAYKPRFNVSAPDRGWAEIEIEASTKLIAVGECIDLVYGG